MIQRLIAARQTSGQTEANASGQGSVFSVSNLMMFARNCVTVIGVFALTTLAMMFFRPELADKFKTMSPFTEPEVAEVDEAPVPPSLAMLMAVPAKSGEEAHAQAASFSEEDAKMLGSTKQQQWVTNWLAKRYRVASDATNMLVSAAYLTAKEIKIDPLLILSVMAIESGLNPFAESPVGAQGLMQVMSKVHHAKFEEMGGVKAALNPVANIKVGAMILKDYVTRAGSVEGGLKLYVGAGAAETDSGYGSRVLTEYRKLKEVSSGKSVPTNFSAPAPAVVPVIRNTDSGTVNKPEATEAKSKPDNKEQVAAL